MVLCLLSLDSGKRGLVPRQINVLGLVGSHGGGIVLSELMGR